ncbi:hypothetical protein AVEN_253944-1 [Araneus ventricosus]|uniref:Uncharacterized protein n=1 Tax=Araneus ventricosus TaxID=182803 RepID=A0A4Y2URV7_ARAVE|nr:hypothetical protein AVEN_253944-1 [Araneus ventricosus]
MWPRKPNMQRHHAATIRQTPRVNTTDTFSALSRIRLSRPCVRSLTKLLPSVNTYRTSPSEINVTLAAFPVLQQRRSASTTKPDDSALW